MYKIGDKVYCKKDFLKMFKKGETYRIRNISDNYNEAFVSSFNEGYWFAMSANYQINFETFIGDYFYTNKELRNLKLQQIGK